MTSVKMRRFTRVLTTSTKGIDRTGTYQCLECIHGPVMASYAVVEGNPVPLSVVTPKETSPESLNAALTAIETDLRVNPKAKLAGVRQRPRESTFASKALEEAQAYWNDRAEAEHEAYLYGYGEKR